MSIDKITELNKRDVGFDIARGVAIILMILQHFWLIVISGYVNSPWLDFIFFLLGTVLVAPVFLFLMGVNTIRSRHNKPQELLQRGMLLIILGYLLSALRFFVPLISAQYLGLINNPENIIYKFKPIYYLLQVDILQLAGLSLIMMALLKWQKIKYDYYLLIAVLISLISPLLWQLKFSAPIWNLITDPFWGNSQYVIFPFFSWAFYSLIGVYFGSQLLQSENKNDFYRDCLVKMIPLSIIGLVFIILESRVFETSYFNHSLGYSLLFTSIIIAWLALINLNYQKISSKVSNFLTICSKKVTLIYFIQWLVIGWLAILINLNIFK